MLSVLLFAVIATASQLISDTSVVTAIVLAILWLVVLATVLHRLRCYREGRFGRKHSTLFIAFADRRMKDDAQLGLEESLDRAVSIPALTVFVAGLVLLAAASVLTPLDTGGVFVWMPASICLIYFVRYFTVWRHQAAAEHQLS